MRPLNVRPPEPGAVRQSADRQRRLAAGDSWRRGQRSSDCKADSGSSETTSRWRRLLPDTRTVYVIDGARENSGDIEAEVQTSVERPRHEQISARLPAGSSTERSRVPHGCRSRRTQSCCSSRQTMRTRSRDVDQFEASRASVPPLAAPVFSQVEDFIGRGVVGGHVWRFENRRQTDGRNGHAHRERHEPPRHSVRPQHLLRRCWTGSNFNAGAFPSRACRPEGRALPAPDRFSSLYRRICLRGVRRCSRCSWR